MALVDEALADLVRDVGLGPSDQPAGGNCRNDSVGGMRGHSQQGDLVRILDRRSSPRSADASPNANASKRSSAASRAWNASRWLAHNRSDTANRTSRPWDGASPDSATAYGSSVSSQVRIGTSMRVPASAAARSRRGTTRKTGASRATTSRVKRSSGIAR